MLLYKLNEEEILEIIAIFANQQLPAEVKGIFDLEYNKEGELEVYFFPKSKDLMN